MKDKIKLGIAGCGFGGTQTMYAPILRLLEKATVTALMDPDQAALDFMTANYGTFDCYRDYDEFLVKADMDAVLIVSPVFLHAEQVIRAARTGRHILCEKPMAPTIEDCDRMLRAVDENGVTLMIGFARRFDKSLQLIHTLLDQGRLGQLFHIHAETSWCHDHSPLGFNWRQSRQTLGGIFQDNATHIIDLCRLWAGEIMTVSGEALILRSDWEVDTHTHAALRHSSGVVTTIHVSNVSHRPTLEYFLIEGTEAALVVESGPFPKYCSPEPFHVHLWEQGQHRTDLTLYNHINLDHELRENNMYKRQVDHFCQCLLENRSPWVGGIDGRKTIEVVNAVYLSSAQNQTITLPLDSSAGLEQAFDQMRL
jgi:UDP-N-acetyl-2-amino-2-deoxyglucuronate dehydrogenase